ncbi:DUF3262 family protein [Vibrio pectenicida]|uniref:DUF3262 family protein n=1 Tax=Vibrio pectenicida TaxID=62763 RepID=A0A3R9F7M3_9VIBR|nr:DUF3262 family protein [Vibrio pectenicida]RSD31713.1 DUF3262 family protein [Vibrio pectenicida]
MNDESNNVTDAFAYGAGFSASDSHVVLAILGTVITLFWVIWTLWSGFKGLRSKAIDKETYRRLIFKAVFVYLALTSLMFYGVNG